MYEYNRVVFLLKRVVKKENKRKRVIVIGQTRRTYRFYRPTLASICNEIIKYVRSIEYLNDASNAVL
jgi:hypothetical protein